MESVMKRKTIITACSMLLLVGCEYEIPFGTDDLEKAYEICKHRGGIGYFVFAEDTSVLCKDRYEALTNRKSVLNSIDKFEQYVKVHKFDLYLSKDDKGAYINPQTRAAYRMFTAGVNSND
jgi:hypothetical protein